MAKAWSTVVVGLRIPEFERIVSEVRPALNALSENTGIDLRYIEIQMRLHLPYFSYSEFNGCSNDAIAKRVMDLIAPQINEMRPQYLADRKSNGIDTLPADCYIANDGCVHTRTDENYSLKLLFDEVNEDIGISIQNTLHYIHSCRKDTTNHFGLFIPGFSLPIAYAALSKCDRKYQINAIKRIAQIDDDAILVMTRAYSYPILPKNTMGKFFQYINKYYAERRKFSAIVTALNPLLGFKGSTFLGSSYVPIASSPMAYLYSQEGAYMNRRASAAVVKQSMNTPPILWLGRGITRAIQKRLDENETIYTISKEEYEAG